MDIMRVALLGLLLAILLAFRFVPAKSRFELNRLAEHSVKYKDLVRFLDIYPGLLMLTRVLALIVAILLTTWASLSWGIFSGGLVAFGAIVLAWLIARMFHTVVQELVGRQVNFFNRYFAWAGILNKVVIIGDEPHISSEEELTHQIDEADFLAPETKQLMKQTLSFRDLTVQKVMTKRDKIAFVHSKDMLTPVFIDELFNSGHKVFPVVQGNLDHVVGLLFLDDVLPIEQEEKVLTHTMRKCPPPIASSTSLREALQHLREHHASLLLVEKDDKVVGLLSLSDIIKALFDESE
jgi:CBS domain containing-hemolysin-like protein